MAQRLTRFSIGQTAKVCGILYGLMGLIFLPIFLLGSLVAPGQTGVGIGFVVLMPFLYALLGFVFTAIGCALYNWVARMVGGFEFSLDSTP